MNEQVPIATEADLPPIDDPGYWDAVELMRARQNYHIIRNSQATAQPARAGYISSGGGQFGAADWFTTG